MAILLLAPGTGRLFGRGLYQAQRLIPFPKMDPQELSVSNSDARLYQTYNLHAAAAGRAVMLSQRLLLTGLLGGRA